MKKTPIVFFMLTPMLLAGCNKNSALSFNNPFSEDSYNKIGFNFKNDETARSPITSDAKDLINKTADEKNKARYDACITSCTSEVHERDYMRAFAGIFKQGYNSSNTLLDSTNVTYRQKEAASPTSLSKRGWTISNTTKIVDYSYGKMSNTAEGTTYSYLGKASDDETPNNKIYDEIDTTTHPTANVINRIVKQTIVGGNITSSEVIATREDETKEWYKKESPTEKYTEDDAFIIKQSDYIFNTTQCTIPAGTYNDEVIIIKETKEQHNTGDESTKGRLILGDKKSFLAMDNTLTVTRLKKTTQTTSEGEETFYYASYVRQYKETVVTSEEIQPNIQITMLSNPIVINYSECIYKFSVDKNIPTSTEELKPVEDK